MSYFGASPTRPGWIDLSLGHAYHRPPEAALQAAAKVIEAGVTGYLPPGGIGPLREALMEKLRSRNQIMTTTDDVVVTAGGSLGLFASLALLASPGTPVLIPDPGFPLYRLVLDTLRLKPVPYRLIPDRGWLPDLNSLPEAPIMIWNSPHNPLGTVADPAFVEELAAYARQHAIWLISDEVYEDLLFTGRHLSPASLYPERSFSVFSFSKSYGMAGWRVGYVAAPPGKGHALGRTHWAAAMSVATAAQQAAMGALSAGPEYHAAVREALAQRREVATAVLERHGVPYVNPQGGFFLWLDLRAWVTESELFCHKLAKDHRVLVNPGKHFGSEADGCVRVCFSVADPTVLEEGLERLCAFLSRL